MTRKTSKSTKIPKAKTMPLGKPKPATKRAVDKALKEGMKRYKNTLKELAKS